MSQADRCPHIVSGLRWGCKTGEYLQCVYKKGHLERGRQQSCAYALPGPALDGTDYLDDETMSGEELIRRGNKIMLHVALYIHPKIEGSVVVLGGADRGRVRVQSPRGGPVYSVFPGALRSYDGKPFKPEPRHLCVGPLRVVFRGAPR